MGTITARCLVIGHLTPGKFPRGGSQELEKVQDALSHFVLQVSSPATSFSHCSSGYSYRWGIILKSGGEAGAEQTPPKYVLHKTRA